MESDFLVWSCRDKVTHLITTFNGCRLGWYGEHMWIVVSAVRPKSESCWYALTKRYKGRIGSFAHLPTWMLTLRRSRQHLTHPVIRAERGKPVQFLCPRQVDPWWRRYNTEQVKEDKASEGHLVMRWIGVPNLLYCESRLTFIWCSVARNLW